MTVGGRMTASGTWPEIARCCLSIYILKSFTAISYEKISSESHMEFSCEVSFKKVIWSGFRWRKWHWRTVPVRVVRVRLDWDGDKRV